MLNNSEKVEIKHTLGSTKLLKNDVKGVRKVKRQKAIIL